MCTTDILLLQMTLNNDTSTIADHIIEITHTSAISYSIKITNVSYR